MTVPTLAAEGSQLPFLQEMLALFGVSVLLTYVCHRLRIVPIVGFLIAGILIGPYGLGLVRDLELIRATAEIGVILLLFTIGMEFSLEELARIRRVVWLGGSLQVGMTVAVTALVLVGQGVGWGNGVYTGFLIALSSTAIVLKLLSDRGAIRTPAGQVSLGVLIFQDLAVVGMVLLIPLLAPGEGTAPALALTLVKAAAIVTAVLLLARRAVPKLLDHVANLRSQELFLLTVVVICFGIAWLANLGGVSLALGAFLAGLVVSGSRFREHAVGEIIPLRTVFNAVFFVSVGMLLDVRFLLAHPGWILVGAAAVLVLKVATTAAGVLAVRYPIWVAVTVGVWLAQIGEFALVLNQAGRLAGLSPAGLGTMGDQAFLGVTILLMLATPFAMRLEGPIRRSLESRPVATLRTPARGEPALPTRDHVIIGGYGLAGRFLESVFQTLRIPIIIVDLNPVSVLEAQARGGPVLYGDIAQSQLLSRAGIANARLLVLAINDPDACRRAVQRARLLSSGVPIVVRTPFLLDAEPLLQAGADEAVAEELESALTVVRRSLRICGVPSEEVDLQLARLRERAAVTD